MVRKSDATDEAVKLREEERHVLPGVRKKFAKQASGWGAIVLLVPIAISLGWIPPTTAADMHKHEVQHTKDFNRLEELYKTHEKLPTHPGAPTKISVDKKMDEVTTQLREIEQRSSTRDTKQQEQITEIQVGMAKLESDAEYIKQGIGDIKNMLNRRP